MKKESTNPITWLSTLNQSILSTICKIDGKQIPLHEGLEMISNRFINTRDQNKSIWWAGNGGSAAICSHLSQDVLNKLGIKSSFSSDSSLMTCMTNDYGYENVYSRPLSVLTEPGDILIAISSSGNSANIINAARVAFEKKLDLISFSGMSEDNELWRIDRGISFYIPSQLYGIVELSHEAILHSVIESIWLEENKIETQYKKS